MPKTLFYIALFIALLFSRNSSLMKPQQRFPYSSYHDPAQTLSENNKIENDKACLRKGDLRESFSSTWLIKAEDQQHQRTNLQITNMVFFQLIENNFHYKPQLLIQNPKTQTQTERCLKVENLESRSAANIMNKCFGKIVQNRRERSPFYQYKS